MSHQLENSSDLRLHIADLQDILASVTLDRSAQVESVWYEFWDAVLNYWIRRSSNRATRLSIAPQRQLTREVLKDSSQVDDAANYSFEADAGDTSMESNSHPLSVKERVVKSHEGVSMQFRIPDFTAFALRRNSLPHRRLVCIIEIKPYADAPCSRLELVWPQIIVQAKFAFDSFPDLLHVFSILTFGDSLCLFKFTRHKLTQLYPEHEEEFESDHAYNPERAPGKSRVANININEFKVASFCKVLKADNSNYTVSFEKIIRHVMEDLRAGLNSLKFKWKY